MYIPISTENTRIRHPNSNCSILIIILFHIDDIKKDKIYKASFFSLPMGLIIRIEIF